MCHLENYTDSFPNCLFPGMYTLGGFSSPPGFQVTRQSVFTLLFIILCLQVYIVQLTNKFKAFTFLFPAITTLCVCLHVAVPSQVSPWWTLTQPPSPSLRTRWPPSPPPAWSPSRPNASRRPRRSSSRGSKVKIKPVFVQSLRGQI